MHFVVFLQSRIVTVVHSLHVPINKVSVYLIVLLDKFCRKLWLDMYTEISATILTSFALVYRIHVFN